ncbi:MAG: HWE histidine kinase domain-containing protein [Phenylobacterium sp.]
MSSDIQGEPKGEIAALDRWNLARVTRAGEAFAERESLYRDILQALPAAIYTTDADGRVTFYNEAAAVLSGRRPVLGEDRWCVTWKLFHPDGRPMPHDECPMAVALKDGQEMRGAIAIVERPDGTRLTCTPYPTLLRDAGGQVVGAVNMVVDITEARAADERQTLLSHEVNHRANNLLAIVQAMLRLTKAPTLDEYREVLEGRIRALAHAHSLLAQSRWEAADLQQLVTEELAPYLGGDRPLVWMSGPPLPLEPSAAQSTAMILHELATNAAKHGALSRRGRVLVDWQASGERVTIRWTEEGGPTVSPPSRSGVGASMIQKAAAHLGATARFDWRAEGLAFELSAPLSVLAPKP